MECEWRKYSSERRFFNACRCRCSLFFSLFSLSFHVLRPGSRRGTGGSAISLVLRRPARRHGWKRKGARERKERREEKGRERANRSLSIVEEVNDAEESETNLQTRWEQLDRGHALSLSS